MILRHSKILKLFFICRVKTNPKNAINEHFLPRFLDFIVWGHEHECLVDPQVEFDSKLEWNVKGMEWNKQDSGMSFHMNFFIWIYDTIPFHYANQTTFFFSSFCIP